MRRRLFLASLAAFLAPRTAFADLLLLSGAEIEVLLSGNTAVGTWSGMPYRQYFDPSGTTVYVPDGGTPDRGRWRVDRDENVYQSWWQSTGWVSYGVARDGDRLIWVDRGTGQPFVVEEGRTVEW